MQGRTIQVQDARDEAGSLNATDTEMLLARIAGGLDRVARAEVSSGAVWIKRCGRPHPSRRLQALVARLFPSAHFLRPSPWVDGPRAVEREMRQMEAFRQAGFATPRVLLASGSVIVLTDMGETVFSHMKALRKVDPAAHDALLVACTRALGEVHAAGLCHGRPHPRDFGMKDGRIGFFDFEEEPAQAMPLASAQARDIWLLFFQVAAHAIDPGTCRAALDAWLAVAPEEAARELARLVRFFGRWLPAARLAGKLYMGGDLERFIKGTGALAALLPREEATGAQAAKPVSGGAELAP